MIQRNIRTSSLKPPDEIEFNPPFLATIFAVSPAFDCYQYFAIALWHHQHRFCGPDDGRKCHCRDFSVFPDFVLPDGLHHRLVCWGHRVGGSGLGQRGKRTGASHHWGHLIHDFNWRQHHRRRWRVFFTRYFRRLGHRCESDSIGTAVCTNHVGGQPHFVCLHHLHLNIARRRRQQDPTLGSGPNQWHRFDCDPHLDSRLVWHAEVGYFGACCGDNFGLCVGDTVLNRLPQSPSPHFEHQPHLAQPHTFLALVVTVNLKIGGGPQAYKW